MNENRPHPEIEAERDQHSFGKPTPYKPGHRNHSESIEAPLTSDSVQGYVLSFVRKFGVFTVFLIAALMLFVAYGMNKTAVIGVGAFGFFMSVPWYFSTRNRDRPPSTSEKVAAGCWLWFRRIVCCGGGILLVIGTLGYGARAPFLASVGAFFVGLYMVYVGCFGQGNRRLRFGDDLELHKQNKKRYRWRF